MSFPNSRANIRTYNPYNINRPSKYPLECKNLNIPFHNAYTSLPAKMNRKGYYVDPMYQNWAPEIILPHPFFQEAYTRNKALSNPYNTYPFYDDPSVMWSAPGVDLCRD